jgi:hypothetical protein
MGSHSKISISLGLLAAVSVGCSKSSPDPTTSATAAVHAMYISDVAGFGNINTQSIQTFDAENNQLFTKIFGGTDVASVQQYYQDRIHYAFSMDDLNSATLTPNMPAEGWLKDPNSSPTPPPQPTDPSAPPSQIEIGALNLGAIFWLEAAVAGTTATLTIGDQSILLDSSRVGVMILGPGYKATTIIDTEGTTYPLPPECRQAILVHEGRHSDCTGGLSQAEVNIMLNATSSDDFHRQIPLPHCGHTHLICLDGTYEGAAACDAEKYGAYKVGAVYLEALIDGQTDEITRAIMQVTAKDYESRYVFQSDESSESPDEQTPNMTSAGLTP